jgi:hypothetical protein
MEDSPHHLTLEQFIQQGNSLPDVLNQHDALLESPQPLDPSAWQSIFEGRLSGSTASRAHLCIPCSQTGDTATDTAFDIDSVLGFATSLSFARYGLTMNLDPQFVNNLAASVHLTLSVPGSRGYPQRQPLHRVPHIYLGRVTGYDDFSVFLFFPRLWSDQHESRRKTSYLTDSQRQRWVDRVLLPAMHHVLPAAALQHYPASFQHARLASTAASMEMRARAGHTPPKHQAIHHAVSGEAMPLMWDCIQQLVQQPGLRDFCDVTIFISAKNLKAKTRQSTLQSTWTNFFGRWEDVLDWNALDPARMWFDIGKETCTRTSLLAQNISTQPRPVPTLTPTTSMWRPCCLEEYCQSPFPVRPCH